MGGPGLEGVGDGGSKVGSAGCWDGPPPVGVFAVGALCGWLVGWLVSEKMDDEIGREIEGERKRWKRENLSRTYSMIKHTTVGLFQRKARKRGIPSEGVGLVLGPNGVDRIKNVLDEGGVGWARRGTLEQMSGRNGGIVFKRRQVSFSCWEGDDGCRRGEEESRDGEDG